MWAEHPATAYEISKAKKAYREDNPTCELCGAKRSLLQGRAVDVHHILPVHVHPEYASNRSNLLSLCRRHHWWVGHCGVSWKTYNPYVDKLIEDILVKVNESQLDWVRD